MTGPLLTLDCCPLLSFEVPGPIRSDMTLQGGSVACSASTLVYSAVFLLPIAEFRSARPYYRVEMNDTVVRFRCYFAEHACEPLVLSKVIKIRTFEEKVPVISTVNDLTWKLRKRFNHFPLSAEVYVIYMKSILSGNDYLFRASPVTSERAVIPMALLVVGSRDITETVAVRIQLQSIYAVSSEYFELKFHQDATVNDIAMFFQQNYAVRKDMQTFYLVDSGSSSIDVDVKLSSLSSPTATANLMPEVHLVLFLSENFSSFEFDRKTLKHEKDRFQSKDVDLHGGYCHMGDVMNNHPYSMEQISGKKNAGRKNAFYGCLYDDISDLSQVPCPPPLVLRSVRPEDAKDVEFGLEVIKNEGKAAVYDNMQDSSDLNVHIYEELITEACPSEAAEPSALNLIAGMDGNVGVEPSGSTEGKARDLAKCGDDKRRLQKFVKNSVMPGLRWGKSKLSQMDEEVSAWGSRCLHCEAHHWPLKCSNFRKFKKDFLFPNVEGGLRRSKLDRSERFLQHDYPTTEVPDNGSRSSNNWTSGRVYKLARLELSEVDRWYKFLENKDREVKNVENQEKPKRTKELGQTWNIKTPEMDVAQVNTEVEHSFSSNWPTGKTDLLKCGDELHPLFYHHSIAVSKVYAELYKINESRRQHGKNFFKCEILEAYLRNNEKLRRQFEIERTSLLAQIKEKEDSKLFWSKRLQPIFFYTIVKEVYVEDVFSTGFQSFMADRTLMGKNVYFSKSLKAVLELNKSVVQTTGFDRVLIVSKLVPGFSQKSCWIEWNGILSVEEKFGSALYCPEDDCGCDFHVIDARNSLLGEYVCIRKRMDTRVLPLYEIHLDCL